MTLPSWYEDRPAKAPGRHIEDLRDAAQAFTTGQTAAQEAKTAIQKVMTSGLKDWQGDARDQAMLRLEKLEKYVGDLVEQWGEVSTSIKTLATGLEDAGQEWNASQKIYAPYESTFGLGIDGVPLAPGTTFYSLNQDGSVDKRVVGGQLPPTIPQLPTIPPTSTKPAPPVEVVSGADAAKGKDGFSQSKPDALQAQQVAERAFDNHGSDAHSLQGIDSFKAGTNFRLPKDVTNDSRIPWYGAVIVQPGDSLWAITATLTGNGAGYGSIYQANKGKLGPNPGLILPGQVLKIPQGDANALDHGKVQTEDPDAYLNSLPPEKMPKPKAPSGHTGSTGTTGHTGTTGTTGTTTIGNGNGTGKTGGGGSGGSPNSTELQPPYAHAS